MLRHCAPVSGIFKICKIAVSLRGQQLLEFEVREASRLCAVARNGAGSVGGWMAKVILNPEVASWNERDACRCIAIARNPTQRDLDVTKCHWMSPFSLGGQHGQSEMGNRQSETGNAISPQPIQCPKTPPDVPLFAGGAENSRDATCRASAYSNSSITRRRATRRVAATGNRRIGDCIGLTIPVNSLLNSRACCCRKLDCCYPPGDVAV